MRAEIDALEHERARARASRRRSRRSARCRRPAEVSTRSCTSVSMRREPVSPSTRSPPAAVARLEHAGADRVVDVVVDVRDAIDDAHDLALERLRLDRAVCLRMPSRTSHVRLSPRPSRSSRSTTRSECSLCRKPRPPRSRTTSSSACSPACPNGGWPRSWPSPIASTRSSFSRSARATPRAMPVVSSVCVSRVRNRGRRCTASVNSPTCASRMTLTAMNSVTPAAGASANRFVTQLGTPSPSKASITRSTIRSRRHPLTAPARPRTK